MKFEAASGAQTQTCVCRNLNQNECTRRRATGVDTQESTRRRATGVGTTCGIIFLRSNDRTCCVSVLPSTWTRGAFWCTLRSISARHACAYRDLPRPHPGGCRCRTPPQWSCQSGVHDDVGRCDSKSRGCATRVRCAACNGEAPEDWGPFEVFDDLRKTPFRPRKRKQGHAVEVEDGGLLGLVAFKDLAVSLEEDGQAEVQLDIQDLWVVPRGRHVMPTLAMCMGLGWRVRTKTVRTRIWSRQVKLPVAPLLTFVTPQLSPPPLLTLPRSWPQHPQQA